MYGNTGSYYSGSENTNESSSGRYSHIPVDQKDKVLFNTEKHNLNVERRIFEREGMFNIDTKNVGANEFYKQNSQKKNNKFGEITGEVFNPNDLEQGMPMRDFLVNDKELLNRHETQNPYLDFNLFENDSNVESISYYDPHQNANGSMENKKFSNVEETHNVTVEEKPDPFKQFINVTNYNSFHMFNTLHNTVDSLKSVISPLSVNLTLMIYYIGSSGDTTSELCEYLKLPDKSIVYNIGQSIRSIIKQSGYMIQHNIIYVPSNIKLNSAFQQYVSELGVIDTFNKNDIINETNRINTIIRKLTHGTVNNVLGTKTLNKDTGLFSINTLIIKPRWMYSFDEQNTKNEFFYGTRKRTVQMMQKINTLCLYVEDTYHQLIELDLKNEFMMGFLLSKQNRMPELQYEMLVTYWKHMKEVGVKHLKIPKFKYQCRYRVDSLLKKLGLVNMFINGNFDNICPSTNNANITDIIHQSIISIDEGSRSNINNADIAKNPSINFIANKPFIYYIRHYPTNTIICIGMYE